MTNFEQKALAAERYPELSPADARKALRRDLKAEREHEEVIRLHQRYQEQCRKDTEDMPRIERDLDMAGIAQTPRRRRINPAMLAIATALMIGGNEK